MRFAAGGSVRLLVVALLVLTPAAPVCAQDEEVAIDEVQVGQRVEVDGSLRSDGTFEAREIERKEADDKIEVTGVVRGVQVDGDKMRFIVLSILFEVDEDTQFLDGAGAPRGAAVLAVGSWVSVKGRERASGKIEARSVRVVAPRPGAREDLEGVVAEVGALPGGALFFRIGPQVVVAAEGSLAEEGGFGRFPAGPRVGPAPDGLLAYRSINEDDFAPFAYPLFGSFFFGGRVRYQLSVEDNFDLDRRRNSDVAETGVSTALRAAGNVTPELFAHVELRIDDIEVIYDNDRDLSRGGRIRAGENFLFYRGLLGLPLDLQVGRQDFDEYREWVYDEDLDAARLFVRLPPVNLELSISEVLFDADPEQKDIRNAIAYGSVDLTPRHQAAAYVVDRDDRRSTSANRTLGLRARGEPAERLRYWSELALARGKDGENRIEGWGLDAGATYVFRAPLAPSVTLGYAYGSGDEDPDDGVDRTFRQTGLQDNNDRWNGVTSFKYYGEILEPELRNLQVFTAGVGVRPTARTSIDLVAHYYLQAETAPMELRPITNLRQDAGGDSPKLGWEVDLIFGSKEWKPMRLELVLGWFHPGSAFERARNDAAFVRLQVDYRF
jgi:hypothetical protein